MVTSTSWPAASVHLAQAELLEALSALYFGGKYSDLTIQCQHRTWAVHRAIVCPRSGFFDGACAHAFREAQRRIIDLDDDDPAAVEQMIYFFYHLEYDVFRNEPPVGEFRHRALSAARRRPPPKVVLNLIEDPLLAAAGFYNTPEPSPPPTDAETPMSLSPAPAVKELSPKIPSHTRSRSPSPPIEQAPFDDTTHDVPDDASYPFDDEAHLLLHSRVYALADKYDIPGLKALARDKFETAMACHYDSPDLAEAIEQVYTSTIESDRGLRNVVLDAFRAHPRLATTRDVSAVIDDTPSLAADLYRLERGLVRPV